MCRRCIEAQSAAATDRIKAAIRNIPGVGPVVARSLSQAKAVARVIFQHRHRSFSDQRR